MKLKEEVLGGCMNSVVKIGDTVHRRVQGHPMLHTYLHYLEQAGMAGVPRFLGLDEKGREILTYLPGKTMGHDYGDFHPCLYSDDTLINMARFMRKLHDVSEGFLPIALESGWARPDHLSEKPETICHNDAAIWNFVFTDDRLAGLFDFDKAGPGTRLWDLTVPVFSTVPLTPSVVIPERGTRIRYEPSLHAAERKRRLKLFFEAYGTDCPPDFIDLVYKRIQIDFCGTITKGAAAGDENSIRMVKEGYLAHYQRVAAFIKERGRDWV